MYKKAQVRIRVELFPSGAYIAQIHRNVTSSHSPVFFVSFNPHLIHANRYIFLDSISTGTLSFPFHGIRYYSCFCACVPQTHSPSSHNTRRHSEGCTANKGCKLKSYVFNKPKRYSGSAGGMMNKYTLHACLPCCSESKGKVGLFNSVRWWTERMNGHG